MWPGWARLSPSWDRTEAAPRPRASEPLCARDEPTVSPAGAVEGLDSSGQNPKPDKANHLRLVAPCLSGRGSNLCCFTGEFSIPQDPA